MCLWTDTDAQVEGSQGVLPRDQCPGIGEEVLAVGLFEYGEEIGIRAELRPGLIDVDAHALEEGRCLGADAAAFGGRLTASIASPTRPF